MIYNKLVIIILILLLFFIIIRKKDNFQDNLNSIMSNKKYLNHFNNLDLKLRKCNNIQECINKYNSCVISFTNEEREVIDVIIKSINKNLDGKFKKIFNKIRFIKVENYIENSLPHTRDRYIVLSQDWFNKLTNKYSISSNFLKYNTDLRKLIYHEQFHIFQRYNQELIEKLYLNYWNLERLDIKLPKQLLDINRTNPDALPDNDNHWLFKIDNNVYILPLCVYNSMEEENIKNTSNIYIIVNKINGKYKIENVEEQIENKKFLISQKKYTEYFGGETGNNYHPNELSASIFELIVEDETNNISFLDNNEFEAYIKMKKFLNDYKLL